jgi:hypothetical protein
MASEKKILVSILLEKIILLENFSLDIMLKGKDYGVT